MGFVPCSDLNRLHDAVCALANLQVSFFFGVEDNGESFHLFFGGLFSQRRSSCMVSNYRRSFAGIQDDPSIHRLTQSFEASLLPRGFLALPRMCLGEETALQ